ncbi:Hypothetical predicted protein [Cloeon dipterum]|uniref:EGF-like domain-containing protein n=1 Tax=Cloeon dipterum TaxID=197152 RepID=A0A8S1DG02_9INSE|nr:Hypothetical predicted protein [Cloeon dipterum]
MQWIASCYALLLLVFNCNLTRGYLIRVEAGNETRACATNDHQHAVAFVQNVENFDPHNHGSVETFSKVDIFNLDGNANEIMHEFDCNLVKSGGCEHWRKENLRMKPNNYEKYPPITDFRWHDIPVIFLNAGRNFWMENFLRNTALHAHFSILTNSNFYFLIDPDYLQMSTFRRRYNEPTPEEPNGRFFWHDRLDLIKTNEINLKNSGKKWELVSLRFSEDDPLGNEVQVNSGEISFPIAAKSAIRKLVSSNVFRNSFFPFFHFRGVSLVKMHLYNVLVPENEHSNASMERDVDFQKETAFCVDVVYLMRSPLKELERAFSITLTTEQGQYLHFTEAQPSKGVDTWHVVRFESLRRFSGKGTLKLSVGQQDLQIGGIKFCPGGNSVIVPKIRGMQQCHSLSTNLAPNPVEEEIFTGIVGRKAKICKRLNGRNCSEMKVCGSKSCDCFHGFTGENCKKPCERQDCSSKWYLIRQCLNDKFNLKNGLCLKACANPMFKFPFCTSQIRKVKPFVWNASPNSISLNMSRSLGSVSDFDHIRVRFREKHGTWWWSKIYKESDGKYFTLEGLKDKTEYVIFFTIYEHDWNVYLQNLAPGEEVTATTCTPIDGSILQLDGASFTVSNSDKKFCQPKQIDVTEISPGKLPISSKIQILDNQDYKKNLNSCKTGTYYVVSVSDIYQNRVEARLECSDENQLTTKHPPRDYPLKPLCLSINESVVQISFEDQLTVVVSSNASAADREKICKPSSLRVIESRKILFSATVDGFESETTIGNCSIGKKYQIILADENEHEMKFSFVCVEPEQIKFQRMTPVVHKIWARKIELDMSQSLNDDQLIEVQHKEEHTTEWKTNSYQKSMGGRLILNFLNPKTLYAIRFVQKNTSIKSKEIETRTKPCLPIGTLL